MRSNPILPGFHPDPSICRVGNDMYLVTSTFEYFPGLPIYHSKDLSNWELIGHAFSRRDQFDFHKVKGSGGMFAPTLRYHQGTFYLVCTLMHGLGEAGSFVLTAKSAAGPWSDPTWLRGAPGIDPSLFFDEDGRSWYTGCNLNPTERAPQQTDIWLQEFDYKTLSLIGPRTVIANGALLTPVWAEGAHLYRANGFYYLLHAEGGTERNHSECVARSRNVQGPYEYAPQNPVLTHRHLGRDFRTYGAGHTDLVEMPDGKWWAVALAMRTFDGEHHALGRETFAVPVVWEDDWPVFAPGVGRIPEELDLPEQSQRQNRHVLGPGEAPDASWLQLRSGPQTWSTSDQGLELVAPDSEAGGADLSDLGTPAFLGQRLGSYKARIQADVELASPGFAGICLYQSENYHYVVGVRRTPDGVATLECVSKAAGQSQVFGQRPLTHSTPTSASIAVVFEDGNLVANLSGQGESGAADLSVDLDLSYLSTERAGGFVGTIVGPILLGPAGSKTLFRKVDIEQEL